MSLVILCWRFYQYEISDEGGGSEDVNSKLALMSLHTFNSIKRVLTDNDPFSYFPKCVIWTLFINNTITS